MVKIALDAGHGMYTAGKRCMKSLDSKETREWVLNSRIVDYVEKELKNYKGIQVLRLDDRTGKCDIPLRERTNKANNWGADILISVHHNAGVSGGSGGGIMVFRQTVSQQKSKVYQRKIYNKLIKHTGLKGNRANPLATANLHMTRESKMPAVLIENGFMDSKTDVPIILSNSHAKKSAKAFADFLVEEFKLKMKSNNKPTNNKINKTLQRGMVDSQVKILQRILKDLNYYNGNVDGSFGPATYNAVKKFQRKNSLAVDGSVGPATRKVLNSSTTKDKDNNKLYRVQTGAFKNKKNAEKLLKELESKGYKGFIKTD